MLMHLLLKKKRSIIVAKNDQQQVVTEKDISELRHVWELRTDRLFLTHLLYFIYFFFLIDRESASAIFSKHNAVCWYGNSVRYPMQVINQFLSLAIGEKFHLELSLQFMAPLRH